MVSQLLSFDFPDFPIELPQNALPLFPAPSRITQGQIAALDLADKRLRVPSRFDLRAIRDEPVTTLLPCGVPSDSVIPLRVVRDCAKRLFVTRVVLSPRSPKQSLCCGVTHV